MTKIIATALALALIHSPAQADVQGAFNAIRLAGSERLAIFALSDSRLPAAAKTERAKLLAQGGFDLPAGTLAGHGLKIFPVLSWDPNVNGGLVNDNLKVGAYTFTIDPENKAKSGLLLGGSLAGFANVALGGPNALQMRYGAMLGYAPRHDLMKAAISAEACLKHLQSPALGLHACLDLSGTHYDLGDSGRLGARIGFDATFAALGGYHDLMVEAGTNRHLGAVDYTQGVIGATLVSAHGNGMATSLSVDLGEKIEGAQVMRHKIELATSFEALKHPLTLSLGLQMNQGGMFLGHERTDHITTLGVSGRISDHVGATLSLTKINSNADFFDDTAIGFGLNVKF